MVSAANQRGRVNVIYERLEDLLPPELDFDLDVFSSQWIANCELSAPIVDDLKYDKHTRDYQNVYVNRRRFRFVNASGKLTTKDWNGICEKYNNKCVCCGKSKRLSRDHIIPLAMGGTNTPDNIQPLCRSCNSRKGAQMIDYRRF